MKKNEKKEKTLSKEEILDILEKNKSLLDKFYVKKIGLFGSYVRGEQKKNSDIDFLVEFEKVSYDNYFDLITALEKLYKKKIELITNGSLSPYILPYVEKEMVWYDSLECYKRKTSDSKETNRKTIKK
jgi:uncharacterized protein